ncbi:MAG TPA: gliding motility-associated C-terminal domain-containing protein, partial [Ohtaekwangia sp.]|nr:gliding motility-associated C-terminal domain-containing protein [Ohtaekwangia sp.]
VLAVCEDTPGTYRATAINLTDDTCIAAVTKENNVSVTWHNNELDATLNESPITAPVSVDRTTSVFARVVRTETERSCPAIARLTLVVNPRPAVALIQGRESFCLSETENGQWPLEIYQVTPLSGAQYFWEIDQEGLQVFGGGEEDDFFAMLQFLHPYHGKLRLQVELNGCTSPIIEKSITVSQTAVTPEILGPDTVDPDEQNVLFTVTPDNSPSSTYSWEVRHASDLSQGGAFLQQSPSMGRVDVDFQHADIILTAQEINTGCSGGVATKQVHIRRPVLDASFQFTPAAACFPAEIATRNESTGADSYAWTIYDEHGAVSSSNLSDPVFHIVNPGEYTIRLIALNTVTGARDSLVVNGITIFDKPSADFTIRTPVYASGADLALYNYSAGASDYHWTFGNEATSFDFEPDFSFEKPGEYNVTLVAAYNHPMPDGNSDRPLGNPLVCYDSVTQVVVVLEGSDFEIPNAFTPNVQGPTGGMALAGGFNDIFLPRVKSATRFHLQIFDRWGSLVYQSNDQDTGWDGYDENGKLMPAGAYVYKLLVHLSDGQHVTRMGDITLIR